MDLFHHGTHEILGEVIPATCGSFCGGRGRNPFLLYRTSKDTATSLLLL